MNLFAGRSAEDAVKMAITSHIKSNLGLKWNYKSTSSAYGGPAEEPLRVKGEGEKQFSVEEVRKYRRMLSLATGEDELQIPTLRMTVWEVMQHGPVMMRKIMRTHAILIIKDTDGATAAEVQITPNLLPNVLSEWEGSGSLAECISNASQLFRKDTSWREGCGENRRGDSYWARLVTLLAKYLGIADRTAGPQYGTGGPAVGTELSLSAIRQRNAGAAILAASKFHYMWFGWLQSFLEERTKKQEEDALDEGDQCLSRGQPHAAARRAAVGAPRLLA